MNSAKTMDASELYSSVLAQIPQVDGNSVLYTVDWSTNGIGEFSNPARDYLILRYNIGNEALPAKLILYNAEGKPFLQQVLSRPVDERFVLVQHLKPGIFTLVLLGSNNLFLTSKIAVY